MNFIQIVLLVYGIFVLLGVLLELPLFFNNAKAKMFIKKISKTGYKIMLIVLAIIAIVLSFVL